MKLKYYIRTFGCQQNEADSERIASYLENQGFIPAKEIEEADYIVINTCMIREMAENRVYGQVNNLKKLKSDSRRIKIVITGCMAGMAIRDKTGEFMKILKKKMPEVDEFLLIDEIGFDYVPVRENSKTAYVPISSGCNNFCSYCVVPYARGREKSRSVDEIITECAGLVKEGYKEIMLLGMNVNSYGADLSNLGELKLTFVKHLGRYRIPTLFPRLLEEVAKIKGLKKISFMSSNPWDFSDELIGVIADNPNISREIHLPVQSGSNSVLKRMNRWYTREEYLKLIVNCKLKIENCTISTDIIVGFCGETDEEFEDTVDLCRKVRFTKAYIAIYSDRPMTLAHRNLKDDIPHTVKKKRWRILEEMINKPNLK